MQRLRFTLVGDGSSDRALIPILTWLLRQYWEDTPIQAEFADLRRLPNPPGKLSQRIDKGVELYPCDLLFVHRDSEGESMEDRFDEIGKSLALSEKGETLPVVCVVPVRMQEAWLLIDESALKKAVGNPSSRETLPMPDMRKLEGLPDPKNTLHDLLRQASGLQGRRLRHFNRDLGKCVQRVAQQIGDFHPLRTLAAFRKLESQVVCHRQRIQQTISCTVF